MTGFFPSFNSGQRKTLAWVFGALGIYWLALIYQLGAQWSVYEQYNYGWAVPFLCVYLLWQRIQKPEAGSRKPAAHFPSSILYFLFALCALLYALTRFFHEANPIWRLTSLFWTIEVIVITLVLLYFAQSAFPLRLVRGEAQGEVSFPSSAVCFQFSNFIFPVCFFLVAVPWPSGVEAFLVQTLTRLNVSGTVEVLGWLGIPALQHANVIEVATGDVGIDEACSGIRSFQVTLMISLFFGEFYRLNLTRRAVCVLAGFVLSFLFNMVRTTLLTWVAARKSVAAVASWHDPAGVTILVLSFLTLWLVAMWLGKTRGHGLPKSELRNRKGEIESTSPQRGEGELSSTLNSEPSTLLVRRLAIALLAWFILVEVGVQCWYRTHETAVAANGQWIVNITGLGSSFVNIEIPPGITAQFRSDENLEGRWRDDTGNVWQLFYFRWLPAGSLNKRVAIQLAKTHGPETCLPAIGMTLKSDLGIVTLPVGNRQFTFRQYLFLAEEHPLHVFYAIYEDPSGSTVLANRRRDTKSRIAAALAGSRNDGQRFLEIAVAGPQDPEQAREELGRKLEKLIAFKE